MRLCTIRTDLGPRGAVMTGSGPVSLEAIANVSGRPLPATLDGLIQHQAMEGLRSALAGLHLDSLEPTPHDGLDAPYRHPPKIWGIGLNYPDHARDLDEKTPQVGPASFMKPDTTIIGPGEAIRLPRQSERVTAEAEIGVIIGRRCKHVPLERVDEVILGFTTIIDMTAEDILRQNPRFLTRSKSFDTFFSFGPFITTVDEVEDVNALTITTWHNGREHRSNLVGAMTFPPRELVAFHSSVMTLLPGDIISCGTPGAVAIAPGDTVASTVTGLGRLENPVERDEAEPLL